MVAALVGATYVSDVVTASAYAALFGLNNACSMTLFGYIFARYFGRAHLGAVQGAGQTILVVGASAGPPVIGFAAEAMGGFEAPLRLAALYPLAAAILAALFLRTPSPVREHLDRD